MRKLMLVIGMAAAVGCGGVSKKQYSAAQAEAAKSQQAAQDASSQVTALQSKVAELGKQNATLQQQVGDLEQKLAATSAAKQDLEAKAAKLSQQSAEYQGKMPIRLNEQLLFKENSSQLTPEAKRTLDSMADAIAQVSDKGILVAGHTDDKEAAGQDAAAKRWQLSTARALAVAKYLVGRGVPSAKIGVAGFGADRPAAPNDTLANRAQNRRAGVALTPANLEVGTVDIKPATLGK